MSDGLGVCEGSVREVYEKCVRSVSDGLGVCEGSEGSVREV